APAFPTLSLHGALPIWLHLNHGPIDLIVEAFGEAAEIGAAYRQARRRFETILTELVEELPNLRRPAQSEPRVFRHPTARRMETRSEEHTSELQSRENLV